MMETAYQSLTLINLKSFKGLFNIDLVKEILIIVKINFFYKF